MLEWIPLARPLQASRGVHFDLQASVMAAQVQVSASFSCLVSSTFPFSYLATTTPDTTPCCH
jgi:hypothetical protein